MQPPRVEVVPLRQQDDGRRLHRGRDQGKIIIPFDRRKWHLSLIPSNLSRKHGCTSQGVGLSKLSACVETACEPAVVYMYTLLESYFTRSIDMYFFVLFWASGGRTAL